MTERQIYTITPPDGEHLTTVNGSDYYLFYDPTVFSRDARGVWQPYCRQVDWPETDPAQEAGRLARIAELEAELAALRSQLITQPATGEQYCPDCGAPFRSGHALIMHRVRKHGYRTDRTNGRCAPEPEPEMRDPK